MCNLYSMTSNQEAIRRLFRVEEMSALNLPTLPAIFPGHDAPVVRETETGERELVLMHWGFILPQKGKAPKDVTNARDGKVRDSRFWNLSFQERRCLVPVTSFAEPKGKKPAICHWFALKGDEPRPLFSFADIWRSWRGNYKGELRSMDTFSFLTTTPNSIVKPIHPNRMPGILREDDFGTWMNGTPDEAFALAKPYAADGMHIVHQGDKVDPI